MKNSVKGAFEYNSVILSDGLFDTEKVSKSENYFPGKKL